MNLNSGAADCTEKNVKNLKKNLTYSTDSFTDKYQKTGVISNSAYALGILIIKCLK